MFACTCIQYIYLIYFKASLSISEELENTNGREWHHWLVLACVLFTLPFLGLVLSLISFSHLSSRLLILPFILSLVLWVPNAETPFTFFFFLSLSCWASDAQKLTSLDPYQCRALIKVNILRIKKLPARLDISNAVFVSLVQWSCRMFWKCCYIVKKCYIGCSL